MSSTASLSYPALDATVEAVNWEAILQTVRDIVGATAARWGQQKSGGYNLIRFLHLDDDEVVVRLPLYPATGQITPEIMAYNVRRTASMLASMEYVAEHTSIPVPHIIHSCLDPELDNVRSPYVVMTKVDGKSLSAVWRDMPDTQREIVLRQVVDILLELSTLRFDKIGSLFKTDAGGWRIEPYPEADGTPEATYTSGMDVSLATVNARLEKIQNGQFGAINNDIDYTNHWFMRSLIPCMYDNSLDAEGFPLMHDDFHSQNILVVDENTHPRITAVIDWDGTGTICTSTFAQYPLFIVDHPEWEEAHPLRTRNVSDQATFNRLLEEAEREKFPDSAPCLSRAFANCKGVYLFEKCIHGGYGADILFTELVRHVLGVDIEDPLWGDILNALWGHILNGVVKKFREEASVTGEAREVLGDEVQVTGLSREDFIEVARKHKNRFTPGGKVLPWLDKVAEGL